MIGGRSDLVRPPGLEQLPLSERHPHVRAEELVRRADENVDIPGCDVDAAVRRVVDGVCPGERAGPVRELDDPADVRRGSDGVRRDGKRDHSRSRRELRGKVVVVELELVGEARRTHDDAEIVRDLEPRRHVPVVIERGDDDLVTLPKRSCERTREEEVERGHALAERDLPGCASEEGRSALVRPLDELVRAPARLVRGADVGVRLPQVRRDGVDHLVRALRSARTVEESESAVERREARSDGRDVEGPRCS